MTEPALAEIERWLVEAGVCAGVPACLQDDNDSERLTHSEHCLIPTVARAILEREAGLRAQLAAEQHEHREACESYVKAASERNEAERESERRRLLGLQYVEVIDSVRAQRDSLLAENAALRADLTACALHRHNAIVLAEQAQAEHAALKKANEGLQKWHDDDQCALRIGAREHARKDAELVLLREVAKAAINFRAGSPRHPVSSSALDTAIAAWRQARGEGGGA